MGKEPAGPELFNEITKKCGLDDREKLIVGYRIGAKDGEIRSFEELANFISMNGANGSMSRQRVHQIFLAATIGNDKIQGKMSKDDWERLLGTYKPNRPIAASRKAAQKQVSMLRKYFHRLPHGETIQYGNILDKLKIPFDKTDDAYGLDELQSCWRFYDVFGIRHFGKFRYCTRCKEDQIKPISDFYQVGDTGKYYSNCRTCNTARCRSYVKSRVHPKQ